MSEYNQLLGAAIYEIRCQLGAYLGSKNDNDKAVRLSAHLAYALHNQVLSLIEGNEVFNLNESRKMIAQAQDIVGCKYIDSFGILSSKKNLSNSRITLLLGGQRSLLGVISDGVISVSAQIDNLTIKWRCVFDSVRSKEALWLDLSSAAGELISDFPSNFELEEEYVIFSEVHEPLRELLYLKKIVQKD